jgi:hypothetical protein
MQAGGLMTGLVKRQALSTLPSRLGRPACTFVPASVHAVETRTGGSNRWYNSIERPPNGIIVDHLIILSRRTLLIST